ncbi:serine hydrolase [Adhaeribacter swui]|nr:serine hydrolase [Adhaeribacter swui]
MAQPKTDEFLKNILTRASNDSLQKILSNPDAYRLQIIYTQINRDKKNHPSFQNYYYNYDPQLYYNPASMVKMPLAFLALEKLNTLQSKKIDKNTPLVFDSSYLGQKPLSQDLTSETGLPSIAHFIKRAFLISENDPYNRLYQFVGQQTINQQLHAKGYPNSRITRQFMGFTAEKNRHTNGIRFLNPDGSTRYYQPPAYNPDPFDFSRKILVGTAHHNRQDSLIQAPFDFTEHNNLPLQDFQKMLQSVMFPESVPKKQRFGLTPQDYAFLYRYLSQYPSETPYPKYDTAAFYDSYVKFFFHGSKHSMPQHVRVFNKVGWAYGFMTDVSYVVDFKNKVEYMLAATLYVNQDGVVNDNQYEYETVGYPFMYHLGQAIYQYELKRKRPNVPDLTKFKISYEKRDPHDTRPVVREVDN